MPSARPDAPVPRGLIEAETGTQALVGYVVDTGQDDRRARAWLEIGPQHTNRVGMLHGGLISMLLDAACGFTASMMLGDGSDRTPLVTVSLTVNFVQGARVGQTVTAIGAPAGSGRKIAHVTGEIRDDEGRLIATCTSVFRKISQGGNHDIGAT